MATAVGDIAEVVVPYDGPTGRIINTFGFQCVDASGASLQELCDDFKTAMVKATTGGLLYAAASVWSVSAVEVEDVKPGTAATVVTTYTSVPGRLTADALPPQCAGLMQLHTGTKGRSYRGRVYLPPATEDYQAGGVWSSTALTDLGTVGTNLLTVFGATGTNGKWRSGVISRYLNKAKRATPILTFITGTSLDTHIRTQRRRVFGVGS